MGAPAIAFHQGSNTLFAFARKSSGFCPSLLADTLIASAPLPTSAAVPQLESLPTLTTSAVQPIEAARTRVTLDSAIAIESDRFLRLACTYAISVAKNPLGVDAYGRRLYNHASWSAWGVLSGLNASSDPAAIEAGGKIVVATRGPGNSYYLASSYGSTWSSWSSIPGGVFSSAPALTAHGYGDLHVIGGGTDNRYWSATRDYDVWSGRDPRGSQTFDSPPGRGVARRWPLLRARHIGGRGSPRERIRRLMAARRRALVRFPGPSQPAALLRPAPTRRVTTAPARQSA